MELADVWPAGTRTCDLRAFKSIRKHQAGAVNIAQEAACIQSRIQRCT